MRLLLVSAFLSSCVASQKTTHPHEGPSSVDGYFMIVTKASPTEHKLRYIAGYQSFSLEILLVPTEQLLRVSPRDIEGRPMDVLDPRFRAVGLMYLDQTQVQLSVAKDHQSWT